MKTSVTSAVVAAFALAVCNVLMGPLNQDEGWYLLAGLNTASGMMPYRDFMFTQGPVMPYVYAAFSPLWGSWGVLGGRVFTALLGLCAAGLCAGVAWRLAPERSRGVSALSAWLLTACCPVFSYFTVIPKTYALSGLFIAAAFFALTGRNAFRFELCGMLLALAAGTRLSLGILLAVVGFGLLFMCRRDGYQWAWFRFGLGGGLVLIALFAPFLVVARDGFLFSQSYHASRTDAGFMKWLMLRAGSGSRLMQGYFMTLFVAGLALAAGVRRGTRFHPVFWLAAAGFVAVTAVHYTAPFPYDDYETPIMPLAAAIASVMLAAAVAESGLRHGVMMRVVTSLALLFICASPMCMNWVTVRQDRFWFQMKDKPDVVKLRETGAWLRAHAAPGDTLLTQDAYLAVEAGMKVLPGLEMGPFSVFPALDDATARKVKVHNVATLKRAIDETTAPYAALSGYSFAVSCPTTEKMDPESVKELTDAISRRYEKVEEILDFGQGHTTLEILRRKSRD